MKARARRTKAYRLPALVLVPGLLVLAVLVDEDERSDQFGLPGLAAAPTPLVAPADAPSGIWFCGGGTVDATAAMSLALVNTTEQPRTAGVTVIGSAASEPLLLEVAIPPTASTELDLVSSWLAAHPDAVGPVAGVVEVDGGGVAVDRVLAGEQGIDRVPCASSASSRWMVPYGSTVRPGARELLVLFNPFVADGVVDLAFSTDRGIDALQAGEGLVVPGQSTVLVDITDTVTVSEVVATTATARSGQVVVDRLQVFDGTGDAALRGLAGGGAHPQPELTWYFPGILVGGARDEVLIVQNPGTERAEIDVELYAADPEVILESVELSVRPGQHTVFDLDSVGVLLGEDVSELTAVVRSANGVAVVADRFASVPDVVGADGFAESGIVPGVMVATGSTTPARRLVVSAELFPGAAGSRLVVFNPSPDAIARVTMTVFGQTCCQTLDETELAPLASTVVDLDALGETTLTVLIDATGPVVAARESVGLTSRSIAPAVPFG